MLLRVAYRITGSLEAAEDMCQEAFFKFHDKGIQFATRDEAKYWLIRVLKNASLNYAKRKARERKAYEKALRGMESHAQGSDKEALDGEASRDIQEALAKLPEKLKSVLVLKEYAGMSYKQIAQALGITEGNVKVRVFRARAALAELMKEGYGDVS